jgi:regulator of nonsense transcripts 2
MCQESTSHPVWEDEDSRMFYEDLLDLKTQVPMILLVDKKTAKAMRAEEAKKNAENQGNEPEKPEANKEAASTSVQHDIEAEDVEEDYDEEDEDEQEQDDDTTSKSDTV